MSKHRADVRPRWGRIGLSAGAGLVVVVALLAAVGILHDRDNGSTAYDPAAHVAHGATGTASPSSDASAPSAGGAAGAATYPSASAGAPDGATVDTDTSLPADSGEGRRAVFSLSRQRVWIVDDDDTVTRTYLVSGSVTDNLRPGTYSVYSRSEDAVGIDDSGTMKWFVRFAHGANAAIGFHDIPVKNGKPLQTRKQLGTPQSHGCIRQKESDALAMWAFAQVGTKVVVTA